MSSTLCSHCHYCKSRLMLGHYTSYLGLWFRCYHHCPHTFSGPVGAVRCLRCVSVPAPGSGLWLCGEALVTDGSQLPVKNRICAQAGCGCLCRVTAACALSFTRARAELTNQSPRFRQWTNQRVSTSLWLPGPGQWPPALLMWGLMVEHQPPDYCTLCTVSTCGVNTPCPDNNKILQARGVKHIFCSASHHSSTRA